MRPLNELTIAADVNLVRYSDLTKFIQSQVRFDPAQASFFDIKDAVEIHLGAEYAFTRFAALPAVRVGFWRETEHAVKYSGTDALYGLANLMADDLNDFSIGGGASPARRLELNVGFDFSSRADTMSLSAIVRF